MEQVAYWRKLEIQHRNVVVFDNWMWAVINRAMADNTVIPHNQRVIQSMFQWYNEHGWITVRQWDYLRSIMVQNLNIYPNQIRKELIDFKSQRYRGVVDVQIPISNTYNGMAFIPRKQPERIIVIDNDVRNEYLGLIDEHNNYIWNRRTFELQGRIQTRVGNVYFMDKIDHAWPLLTDVYELQILQSGLPPPINCNNSFCRRSCELSFRRFDHFSIVTGNENLRIFL